MSDGTKDKKISREIGFPVLWLITPAALWMFVFLILPLVSIIFFSFWTSTGATLEADLTLKSYGEFFYTEGFFDSENRRFLKLSVFIRTLGITTYYTLVIMVLCIIIGYPIAYFLAMQVQNFKWQVSREKLKCKLPFRSINNSSREYLGFLVFRAGS